MLETICLVVNFIVTSDNLLLRAKLLYWKSCSCLFWYGGALVVTVLHGVLLCFKSVVDRTRLPGAQNPVWIVTLMPFDILSLSLLL